MPDKTCRNIIIGCVVVYVVGGLFVMLRAVLTAQGVIL